MCDKFLKPGIASPAFSVPDGFCHHFCFPAVLGKKYRQNRTNFVHFTPGLKPRATKRSPALGLGIDL
jgi:hypothetical protein